MPAWRREFTVDRFQSRNSEIERTPIKRCFDTCRCEPFLKNVGKPNDYAPLKNPRAAAQSPSEAKAARRCKHQIRFLFGCRLKKALVRRAQRRTTPSCSSCVDAVCGRDDEWQAISMIAPQQKFNPIYVLICPTGKSAAFLSSPVCKNKSVPSRPKSLL
jgi:hypothetical protein